ncbi:hypothetical protein [Chelativorans sp. YIM 93263]|uniref:hypothetical protein n=1 Tax=Chelativorans sp. YIM 93263 TaxID=2906648 RepID=UPI0023783E89|nr:hypothetical protein [Chelativorans sp. YIM 93263]
MRVITLTTSGYDERKQDIRGHHGCRFCIWDANQFIALGAETGALVLQDRPDGEHRDRLADCTDSKNALVVDPNAAEPVIARHHIPQPVRDQVTAIAAACGADFQAEGRDENAFLADDVNHDGTYDFLLDHALACPARTKALCDASGCPSSLFVYSNGDWQPHAFHLYGYKELTMEGFLLKCSTEINKAGVFTKNGKLVRRDCS